MSALAPIMQGFFTERLARQRQASPNTIASYRDTMRLLLAHITATTGKQPSTLDLADLGPEVISGFLDHLQADRDNSTSTRNNRLAAIRSLFSYAALRHPEHADLIAQVLAIPTKRRDRDLVDYLHPEEAAALAAAPDTNRWEGRRDQAMIKLALQTGLRISELIGLRIEDIQLGTGAHLRCRGKGRKERVVPLTAATVQTLRTWIPELTTDPGPLFQTRTGRTLSRDAIEHRLARHTNTATAACPTLASKQVTAHTLRHTCAMDLLHAGVDPTVIALWLGHEDVRSTVPYLHADLAIKERALARTGPGEAPIPVPRFKPTDTLLAYLESL